MAQEERPNGITDEKCEGKLARLQKEIEEALQTTNEVRLGNGYTFVRIPRIKGRIRVIAARENGGREVEYIYKRWYDPEKKQCRNRKTVIGTVCPFSQDAMIPHGKYDLYFDRKTGEV